MDSPGTSKDRIQRKHQNGSRGPRPMRTPECGPRAGPQYGPPDPYYPIGPSGTPVYRAPCGYTFNTPRNAASRRCPRTGQKIAPLLVENRIAPLDRPSPMFPNANWFCHLCHQHFSLETAAVAHCRTSVHCKKKAALDLRKVVLALPRKLEPRHEAALETELQRVYSNNRMTDENLDQRRKLVAELDAYVNGNLLTSPKLQGVVDKRWLKLKLNLQGSSLCGLGLSTSDVNVDLHLPKSAPNDVQAKVFFEVLRLLEVWPSLRQVEAHFNLKVPKIRGVHGATGLVVEVGLGGSMALKTNRLLADYASLDSRVRVLAVCFRYWANKCRLDDPTWGTLPAHSFPIMVIYFLQQCSPPVVPCIHDVLATASVASTDAPVKASNGSDKSDNNSNGQAGSAEDEEYETPPKLAEWKSENTASVAELWVAMLRFYAAEFKLRKVCVSLRSRKKALLSARRWPSRYIGIEDPFCKKKSLSRAMINDQIMTYFLMCLRSSSLYFTIPRKSGLEAIYDPAAVLNLDIVEDPDGDDIEDGLAANEEVDEEDDDQEKDNSGQDDPTAMNAAGASDPDDSKDSKDAGHPSSINLVGWDQPLPPTVVADIAKCDQLNYCMKNVSSLTGGMVMPKACATCRMSGHRSDSCSESRLPLPLAVAPTVFDDSDDLHTTLCRYIHKKFRPAVSEVELQKRIETVKAIEEFIQKSIPESYLTLFGSSQNGFSLEKADLDICLKYHGKTGVDNEMDVRDIIFRVATILDSHPKFSDVQPIASAKVPIVKFHHDEFGVDGDISLYNVLAEHNTAMLRTYSSIDDRVVPLGAALKQLVKLCDMGDASRGSLSSYAYVIMLIHYLQQESVVPILQKLPPADHPEGAPLPTNMVDGWDAYYFDDLERLDEVWPNRGKNKKTVGQLWLGLIDYFATKFRFDLNVVCIRQLEPMCRLEKMWTNKKINIEDPFELDHNLGAGVSNNMAKYIFSALITSRNWFVTPLSRPLSIVKDGDGTEIYNHFMNPRELAIGWPPKDHGCRRCGKIGHRIKDCPTKTNHGEANGERRQERRACHHCREQGHVVKDCPLRLQQLRQQRTAQRVPVATEPTRSSTRGTAALDTREQPQQQQHQRQQQHHLHQPPQQPHQQRQESILQQQQQQQQQRQQQQLQQQQPVCAMAPKESPDRRIALGHKHLNGFAGEATANSANSAAVAPAAAVVASNATGPKLDIVSAETSGIASNSRCTKARKGAERAKGQNKKKASRIANGDITKNNGGVCSTQRDERAVNRAHQHDTANDKPKPKDPCVRLRLPIDGNKPQATRTTATTTTITNPAGSAGVQGVSIAASVVVRPAVMSFSPGKSNNQPTVVVSSQSPQPLGGDPGGTTDSGEDVPSESFRRILHNLKISFEEATQAQQQAQSREAPHMREPFGGTFGSQAPPISSAPFADHLSYNATELTAGQKPTYAQAAGAFSASPHKYHQHHHQQQYFRPPPTPQQQQQQHQHEPRQVPPYLQHLYDPNHRLSQHQQPQQQQQHHHHQQQQPQQLQQHQSSPHFDYVRASPIQHQQQHDHQRWSAQTTPHTLTHHRQNMQNNFGSNHPGHLAATPQAQPTYTIGTSAGDQQWTPNYFMGGGLGGGAGSVWSPPNGCLPPAPPSGHYSARASATTSSYINERETPSDELMNVNQYQPQHPSQMYVGQHPDSFSIPPSSGSQRNTWGTSERYYDSGTT